MEKTCSTCKTTYSFDLETERNKYFGNNIKIISGLNGICKNCLTSYGNKYYAENKEKERERRRVYNNENKDAINERARKRRAENKEKEREYHREYRKKNKERVTKIKQDHYLANKEHFLEKQKERRYMYASTTKTINRTVNPVTLIMREIEFDRIIISQMLGIDSEWWRPTEGVETDREPYLKRGFTVVRDCLIYVLNAVYGLRGWQIVKLSLRVTPETVLKSSNKVYVNKDLPGNDYIDILETIKMYYANKYLTAPTQEEKFKPCTGGSNEITKMPRLREANAIRIYIASQHKNERNPLHYARYERGENSFKLESILKPDVTQSLRIGN